VCICNIQEKQQDYNYVSYWECFEMVWSASTSILLFLKSSVHVDVPITTTDWQVMTIVTGKLSCKKLPYSLTLVICLPLSEQSRLLMFCKALLWSKQPGLPLSLFKKMNGTHDPMWHLNSVLLSHSFIFNCQHCSSSCPPLRHSTFPLHSFCDTFPATALKLSSRLVSTYCAKLSFGWSKRYSQ